MLQDKDFVVYAYVRADGSPYYIGKGRPDRPYKGGGRPCRTPSKNRIKILHEDLDEFTAFSIESALIFKYGRKDIDSGRCYLKNRSTGWEGISGSTWSDHSRKKLANSKSIRVKWYHPDYTILEKLSATELAKKFPELNLSKSSLSFVIRGVYLMHKGWMTYDRYLEEKFKRDNFLKGVSENPGRLSKSDHRNKRRNWYHDKFGIIKNKTAVELQEIFPEMRLHKSGLYNVANGKSKSHKGWFIVGEGEKTPKWLLCDNKLKSDWFHPDHGKFLNTSVVDLIKLFPEQDYKQAHFYLILKGKKQNYRGWRVLLENEKDLEVFNQERKFTRIRSRDGSIKFNWFHPEHGEFLNCSVREIKEKFSHLKLRTSSLYEVSNGSRDSYKGWTTIRGFFQPSPKVVESQTER